MTYQKPFFEALDNSFFLYCNSFFCINFLFNFIFLVFFVMSQNVFFNENSQKSNFENRSNNFTLPALTNLNKENLTHCAESLNLMFSDSVRAVKTAMQTWTLRL